MSVDYTRRVFLEGTIALASARAAVAGMGPLSGTYIIVAAGQSNMIGYGRERNIDPTIDRSDERIFQYSPPLGFEVLPPAVAACRETAGWVTAGATISAINGALEITSTSMSNPRVSRSVQGLSAGASYLIQGTLFGVDGQVIDLRCDSPQTQRGTSSTGRRRVRFLFAVQGSVAQLQIVTQTATMPIGTMFRVADLSVKEVRPTGRGQMTLLEHRDPMDWPVYRADAYGPSPASHMAKCMIQRGADRVIIVPCAEGGARLHNGPWSPPDGLLYRDTLGKLHDVVTTFSSAKVVGAWIQGEADANSNVTKLDYLASLRMAFSGFRQVGGARMQWIIGSMVPEHVAINPRATAIDEAHRFVASVDPNSIYVPGPYGFAYPNEVFHYNAEGCRRLGSEMGNAVTI